MNTPLSVQEVSALPWGSAVHAIVGVIELLHPPKNGAHWSLQNGKLRDARTGAVIEFMLSKHKTYWNTSMAGQRVLIESTSPQAMIWTAQAAKPNVNGGQPFAKLEVSKDVTISWPDKADLFGAHLTPPPSSPLPTPPSVAAGVGQGTLPPTAASGHQPPAAGAPDHKTGTVDVRHELRQMIALHAVVSHEVELNPIVAAPTRDTVTEHVFAAACAAGLHRHLDPNGAIIEMDPSQATKLRPNFTKLGTVFAGKETVLDMLLRGNGTITMGQTWRDLTEDQAAEVLKQGFVQEFMPKNTLSA